MPVLRWHDATIGLRLRDLLSIVLVFVGLVGLGPAVRAAEPAFPALTGRIVDAAGLLDGAARQRIEGKLAAHEAKTTDQIVVATVPTLGDLTVEEYGNRLFRQWALGQKDRNNGILLLVAPKERKLRIEVGYGLEGTLTDALSKVIITTAIAPRFKQGDYAGGIEAGVDAIASILTGDAEEWQRRAAVRQDEPSEFVSVLVFLAVVFVFVVIVSIMMRTSWSGGQGVRYHRRRDGRWVAVPMPMDRGGWSGGGWSGGSSGGGFSGGGGSSGGGGASGEW